MPDVVPVAPDVTAPAPITPPAPDNTPPAPVVAPVVAPSPGSDAAAIAATEARNAWLAGLSDENRELANKKNWADQNAALKSYSELEKMKSAAPAEVPAPVTYKAEDFALKIPENAKDIGYSESFATAYKDMMAKVPGMSPEMANAVHDWYTGFATEQHGTQMTAYAEQLSTRLTETEAALTKAWGASNNPTFSRNLELATRTLNQLGLMDSALEAGLLVKVGEKTSVVSAPFFEAFAKIGQAMYAEDAIHGAPATGVNPFDPKTASQAQQGALIKSDPQKALLLIAALPASEQEMWKPVMDSIRARAAKGGR